MGTFQLHPFTGESELVDQAIAQAVTRANTWLATRQWKTAAGLPGYIVSQSLTYTRAYWVCTIFLLGNPEQTPSP